MNGIHIDLDKEMLRPLVRTITEEVVASLDEKRAKLNGRLAYRLDEAASLLGLRPHQLRDARRRGLVAGKVVGRRLLFTRDELEEFLKRQD